MQNPIISGIYKITSTINNEIYIGCSANITDRWRRHLNELKRNKHHSVYLQNHVNKHGMDILTFNILEEMVNISDLPTKDFKKLLLEREQYWLDLLSCKFNMLPTAGSNLGYKQAKAKYYYKDPNKELYLVRYKVNGKMLNFNYHKTTLEAEQQVELLKTLSNKDLIELAESIKKPVKNYSYNKDRDNYSVHITFKGKKNGISVPDEETAKNLVEKIKNFSEEEKEQYFNNRVRRKVNRFTKNNPENLNIKF